MKTKYKLHFWIFFLLTLISSSGLQAQMTGNYTIDSTTAASSTNFRNWYSFWRSLQGSSRTDGGPTLSGGISASVNVTVKTSLTDTSKVKFPAITGTSSSKTITIDGNGKVLSYSGAGEVVSFQGGDYITLKNLTIRNNASSSPICVRFYNNSDHNILQSCTLEFSSISSGSKDGSAFVAFSASASTLTSVTSTLNGSYNRITKNLCRTTNSNSPGPAFGMVLGGSTSGYKSTAHDNSIDSNTIQNFYYVAIHTSYGNGTQINWNDISRANASSNNSNSFLRSFVLNENYATSQNISFSNNYIHDLPFSGATPVGGVSSFTGMEGNDNFGSSSYGFVISTNTFKNISVYDLPVMAHLRNSGFLQITQNTVDKLASYNTSSSTINVWDIVTGDEFTFSNNTLKNCDLQAQESYFMVIDSFTANTTGWCMMADNLIQNNTFNYDGYIMTTLHGNWKMLRNKIFGNSINGGGGGYLYCLMPQEFEKIQIFNNLIAGNIGDDGGVGIYAVSFNSAASTFEMHQNIVYQDGTNSPSSFYDNNGYYLYPYYCTDIKVSGNVAYIVNGNSGVPMGIDCSSGSNVKLFDNNSYYVKNIGSEYWFVPGGNSATDFAGWQGLGFAGAGENFVDPKFTDIANWDFRPKKWQLQNSVATQASNPLDINLNTRNPIKSDRGCYEQSADIKAVSSTFSIGSSVCSGYSTNVSIKIQNLFSDTVYDFNVTYSVNGGPKISEKVTKKLLPNDTTTVKFSTPLTLNKWGKMRIAVFVDIPDDNPSNDSLIFNTTVKPAPGGWSLTPSSKPTKAIYRSGPYDIAFVGVPLYYTANAPRGFLNVDYGTKWNATAWAVTQGGNPAVAVTYVMPSGGNDQEVKFLTTSTSLEDTLIKVCLKVTDLTNGCDTTICRKATINSSVVPNFTYPSLVCGNDSAKFINKSTVKSGAMHFHWNFGTGNAKDTSDDVDPVFKFPGAGTYKVKLTAFTDPWNFATYDSAMVTVSAKPTSKFSRTNACEGHPIVFTNQSTPTTSTYLWDFGDGNTSTTTNPQHTYASTGQYTVKLVAKLNGCYDTSTLKVLEYDAPVANFSKTSGTCDNETIAFKNSSTVTGVLSSYWSFGDGGTTNTTDASHKYTVGGNKSVKLVVKSEFGCMDSITKVIPVKEAPKVAFSNSALCNSKGTVFTNNTPSISGTVANYYWTFGDGGTSTAKSPTHKWSILGSTTVMLKVMLDNGCYDSIKSNLSVLVTPKADFTSNNNICSGGIIAFNNNSTWSSGTIGYSWDFGDSSFSTNSDPQHRYNVSKNTTYFVTLIATIQSGCSDSMIKSVTINALPKTCNFDAQPDYAFAYYGMKFEPKNDATGVIGGENGINYSWYFGTGDSAKTADANAATQYKYLSDGSYNVTMVAKVAANTCYCSKTSIVKMDRAGTRNVSFSGLQIYPNPSTGIFNILTTENMGQRLNIQVHSVEGNLVLSQTVQNQGLAKLNLSDVAEGIYVVSIYTETGIFKARLEVVK